MRVDDLVGSAIAVTYGESSDSYMCGKLLEVLDDGTLRLVSGRVDNEQYHFIRNYLYVSVYKSDIKQELKR